MSETEAPRRHGPTWWQTIIMLICMLAGFAAQWIGYTTAEKEKAVAAAVKEAASDAKLNYLVLQVQDFSSTRYTKSDGERDREIFQLQLNDLAKQLQSIERRLDHGK